MIWSFIKIAVFLVLVAALTYGATLLADSGQGIVIQGFGYELNPQPLQAAIFAVILFFVIWAVIRVLGLIIAFLRFLNGDETAISRYFDRNRERKGYQALSDGLMALASGEGRLALMRAKRCRFRRAPARCPMPGRKRPRSPCGMARRQVLRPARPSSRPRSIRSSSSRSSPCGPWR